MNYELAKQLKDAGFDQELIGAYDSTTFSDGTYVPSLSELIKACGDGFDSLRKRDTGFIAFPTSEKLKERREWHLAIGSPEEAVARLWIALNAKVESNDDLTSTDPTTVAEEMDDIN